MSKNWYAVDESEETTAVAKSRLEESPGAEPLITNQPASRARRYGRGLKVLLGCALIVIGLARLCNGLVALTGATALGTRLEFNGAGLYYTSAVSPEDAKHLGDYLTQQKFFTGRHISLQLTKAEGRFQVRFPVKPGIEKDKAYAESVRVWGAAVSKGAFKGAPLEVHLCNSDLKTLRVVPGRTAAK